jgi:predicted N-formylglutamate amidohydrolase
MYRHGTARGIAHALLEVRNDLIAEPAGVLEWTDRLEAVLRGILADETMHRFQHFGSHADAPDEGSRGTAP